VAVHLALRGDLVAEPAAAAEPEEPAAAAEGPQGAPEGGTAPVGLALPPPAPAAPAPARHPAFESEAEAEAYVAERLPAANAAQLAALLRVHGPGLPAALDLPTEAATEALARAARIGPKTAEKLKASWDGWWAESGGGGGGGGGSGGGGRLDPGGLRMGELLASPPSPPFPWGPSTRCYSPQLHAAEVAVAECAGRKAALARAPSAARAARVRKWVRSNRDASGVELSAGQEAAISAASDAPILVITGGPGCGKTTAVQTIVKLWCAQGKVVRICAPTGRAAQRMGSIQGIEPSTIHRMLGYRPHRGPGDGGDAAAAAADAGDEAGAEEEELFAPQPGGGMAGGRFEHTAHNRLPAHAVLVDEASMLSLPLAAALMQAASPRAQLVLVGDVDQLPPVGPGAVLHALIASGLVPVVDLREIFRQAAQSSIVTSALAVRRGEAPALRRVAPDAAELAAADTDALVVRAPSAEALPGVVQQTVAALAAAPGFVEGDLQVISPMRRGRAGTLALNPALQALLNPPSPQRAEVERPPAPGRRGEGGAGGASFREGDRVLQLVNNYDKEVFNGDQGRVVRVWPAERRLEVEFPHLAARQLAEAEAAGGGQGAVEGARREYRVRERGGCARLGLRSTLAPCIAAAPALRAALRAPPAR
jgi:hypothetical protein